MRRRHARARPLIARSYTPQASRASFSHSPLLRLQYDHDTTGTDTLVAQALSAAPNDPVVLRQCERNPFPASACSTAATGSPNVWRSSTRAPYDRSLRAANQATGLRRWDDARRYADASVALDSTDARGWGALLDLTFILGDTIALRRHLDRALAHVSRPDNKVLLYMAYIGGAYGSRFVALSARELGVTTLLDSVTMYYAVKADVFHLRRATGRRARLLRFHPYPARVAAAERTGRAAAAACSAPSPR